MNYIVEIVRKNRLTFYDARSGKILPVWLRYVIIFALAVSFAKLASPLSSNFISSLISAFSIIAGFGFSIQLFLVDHKFDIVRDKAALEEVVENEKVDRVAFEVFDNVSYLNLISLLGVIQSVLLSIAVPNFVEFYAHWAPTLMSTIASSVLFFALIEMLLTFFRITNRLTYIFDRVRRRRN